MSSTTYARKYSYHFGIDEINFSQITINKNMCFISQDIEIDTLSEDEYIQLSAEYSTGGNGSIEFYIIDGSEPIAILPIGTETVLNEKIFSGLRSRFAINEDEPVIVKKDGVKIDLDLEQAINSNEDGYTVSYTPLDAHNVKPINNTIKIKAILRTYDENSEAPFIKSMAVRKYGRSSLWLSSTTD